MPELPEVERAVLLIRSVGAGKIIEAIETNEDTIVYSGTTHAEFASEIKGRKLTGAQRYGKVFYLELEGKGRVPVLHFGMTGMLQVRGQLPMFYKSSGKSAAQAWPPRYMKFILHLVDKSTGEKTELAYMDARRLGRIRLCASPPDEPPISELGFDPILSMPPIEEFSALVLKRTCPIKALLLDQSFSAGVGNWVADEILYNARIHPEHRCHTLNEEQLQELHHQTRQICVTAVSVNADSSKFPESWLMVHRWGKGKKAKSTLLLPSGEPATIKWITVGGRTSAYVAELQKPPPGQIRKQGSKRSKRNRDEDSDEDNEGVEKEEEAADKGAESDLADLSDLEGNCSRPRRSSKSKRKVQHKRAKVEVLSEGEDKGPSVKHEAERKTPRKARASTRKSATLSADAKSSTVVEKPKPQTRGTSKRKGST
ncbi:hypothetical protein BDN72DRAFT_829861 [Pluteus cervinus]|uniref:Uncharacterized protein n=1 Tax=Pluteus cervinus TaxID=181527 RepID=A0ACD3BFM0_9AGAR|nr:hypothetical protein BDN72DRAFT_829861 [Pluteus cervinus]